MKNILKNLFVAYVLVISNIAYSEGGVLLDLDTNLEWELQDSTHNKWEGAISYCNKLSLNGNEWRLPNLRELLSLIDFRGGYVNGSDLTASYAKSDFRNSTNLSAPYWSSTANYINKVRSVSYKEGKEYVLFKIYTDDPYYYFSAPPRTRCVRNYKLFI